MFVGSLLRPISGEASTDARGKAFELRDPCETTMESCASAKLMPRARWARSSLLKKKRCSRS